MPRPAYEVNPKALLKVCGCDGSGDAEEARDLIARGINVDEQNKYQETALHYAASRDLIDIVQELIRAGVAIDVQKKGGMTALHYAAMNGVIDIVRELIRAGAALDVKDEDGVTALQFARESENDDIVALLEEARAAVEDAAPMAEGGLRAQLAVLCKQEITAPPPPPQ